MSTGEPLHKFAEYTLDVGNAQLHRDSERVPLTPKAFDVLTYLVKRAGQLVTKTELLDEVWDDPLVTDAVPARAHPALDDGAAVVAFANCPFARLASEQPDLVCGLHRGIVAGFVAEMGDAEVREFCTLTARTPCQVTVATR